MCPEKHILSAYIDKELPVETMETISNHVHHCSSCASAVGSFLNVRDRLGLESVEDRALEIAQERVLRGLEHYQTVQHSFFRRKVGIGWVAAAASFAFVLGTTLSSILFKPKSMDVGHLYEPHPTANITINVKNMKQVLEILNSQPGIREITIQLPESSQFEFRSEPVFIRASELNRSSFK